MGQNPIQRSVRTTDLSVHMTVHSFSTRYNAEQNSSDNLPSYHSSDVYRRRGGNTMWKPICQLGIHHTSRSI